MLKRFLDFFLRRRVLFEMGFESGMIDGLFSTYSFGVVICEEFFDEILGLFGYLVSIFWREFEFPDLYFFCYFCCCLSIIRWIPTQHNIHYDPYRPDVTLLIVLPIQDLWCDVIISSTCLLQLMIHIEMFGCTKIYDLQGRIILLV